MGKYIHNILRPAGITDVKSRFVWLAKDVAITATFLTKHQLVENRREEEEIYYTTPPPHTHTIFSINTYIKYLMKLHEILNFLLNRNSDKLYSKSTHIFFL